MNITAAEWSAGKLTLTSSDPEAVRFAIGFEAGDYTLAKAKKHRSLDANAYAWVLIDKLAAELRIGKEEIYRNTIRDIGGNSEIYCGTEKAIQALCKQWVKNGIGWQAETMPSKLPGCVNAILYYGSSSYDTKQMSILIDRLIQDCKALDIETMPPDKLAGLLEAWDGQKRV